MLITISSPVMMYIAMSLYDIIYDLYIAFTFCCGLTVYDAILEAARGSAWGGEGEGLGW